MSGLEILLVLLIGGAAAAAWFFRTTLLAERGRHAQELTALRGQRDTELRAQADRTAALFDRMVEGIIVVGANGKIRLANQVAGALFGFKPPAHDRTVLEATRHHEVAALVARLE